MDLLCGYKVHPSVLPMSNGSDVGCEVVKSCMISQRTWKHASGVTAAKKKDTSFHLNEYRFKLSPGFSPLLLGLGLRIPCLACLDQNHRHSQSPHTSIGRLHIAILYNPSYLFPSLRNLK